MTKKSTNKEILVLIVLLLILAVYAFYSLLLSPKINEVKELDKKVETEDLQIRNMYNAVLQFESNAKTVRDAKNASRELTKHFFVRTNQETYIDLFNTMLTECDVTFVKIEAIENEDMDLLAEGYRCDSPYIAYFPISELEEKSQEEILLYLQKKIQEVVSKQLILPHIEQMTFKVEANCSYSSVEKLIEQIHAFDKYVSCVKLDVDVYDEANVFTDEDPAVWLHMDIQFPRIDQISCLDESEDVPKFPSEFVMPADFISEDYKKPFSFSNLIDNLKGNIKDLIL